MVDPNEPNIRHEEIHISQARGSTAGWWVAAVVAVAALAGAVYVFSQGDADNIVAARESGRAEAMVETAAAQAQAAADQAGRASSNAAATVVEAKRAAAERAASVADRTARAAQNSAASAQDAAADASDTALEPGPVN
jgi:uncharacterized protein HemX